MGFIEHFLFVIFVVFVVLEWKSSHKIWESDFCLGIFQNWNTKTTTKTTKQNQFI
jgi:hypothetical protein